MRPRREWLHSSGAILLSAKRKAEGREEKQIRESPDCHPGLVLGRA